MAVASAGIYASLHLAPERKPCQHPITQFFTGRMPFLQPNQQRQSTEGAFYLLLLTSCIRQMITYAHTWHGVDVLLQLLQEELSGSHPTQADFLQLGQSITSDSQQDDVTGRVTRQMSEVRDTADRLQSTLSELESSLTSLVDTTERFDSDLATLSATVASLTDRSLQLPAAVGFQSAWFTEQNLVVRVRTCVFSRLGNISLSVLKVLSNLNRPFLLDLNLYGDQHR